MIIIKCDTCKQELKKEAFTCDMVVREVKERLIQTPQGMITKPQLEEKQIHFCQACFNANIKSYVGMD